MKPSVGFAMVVVLLAVGASGQKAADSVEDIYIARSVRLARATPTDFCAEKRLGFRSENEDRYSLRAVTTQGPDSRVTKANGPESGRVHGCFGSTSDPRVVQFYAEGSLGTITFTGRGECRLLRADFPEAGISPSTCFLDLSNLPANYVGGLLTSNSVRSRQAIGDTSDPQGYVQPSIATIRLWKKR